MAKLLEMVRSNLPHISQRSGSYKLVDNENIDPFTRGILFNAQFVASVEVPKAQHDCPEVQDKVKSVCEKAGKSLRRVTLVVKSNNIRVTDISNQVFDDYAIHRIAYGGRHLDMEDVFYFIHKTKIDKALRAEVFKFENAAKVKAITRIVSKAFNIAYKGWMTRKRNFEKEKNRGAESPVVQTQLIMSKLAPGVANTSDIDQEFQELAESRVHRPDVLRTSLAIDETDAFTFDSIKAHIDEQ